MGKYVYNGSDITDIIKDKEKRIIKVYAEDKGISIERSKEIYLHSTVKRAIREVNNGLWMQSEYYILEAYGSYLDKVKVKKSEKVSRIGKSVSAMRYIDKALGKIQKEAVLDFSVRGYQPHYAAMKIEECNPKYWRIALAKKAPKVKRQKREIEMTLKK